MPRARYTSKVAFQLHDLRNRRLQSSFACGDKVLHLGRMTSPEALR